MSARVEKTIDVKVPVNTAYAQWTQFESFPQFMEDVVEVRQLNDTTLHWKANIAGKEKEWDAQITEQTPGQRIAWKAVDGAPNAGVVTFHHISDGESRIALQLEAETDGLLEEVGDKLGVFGHRVESDLKRFKEFVESRGAATGAWDGQVERS